ncbi:hypothetical protein [Deefgea salmonis]|uniref:Uncharacterized protein n=1 Tax=Deefgea salmonis TaxID=2875502 RepID=A0ABS8BIH8_9NEIS|nr:hypothetical protein [Deefgea salmonis]MCB5195519.1 hypothetical protein [Deefgea salmonis]
MKWRTIQSLIAWAYHRQGITAYSRWMSHNPTGQGRNPDEVAAHVIDTINVLPPHQAALIRAAFTGRPIHIDKLAETIPELMPCKHDGCIALPFEYRQNCVLQWTGAIQQINFRAAGKTYWPNHSHMKAARLYWRLRDNLLDPWLSEALATLAVNHQSLIEMQPAQPSKPKYKSTSNQLSRAQIKLISVLAAKEISNEVIAKIIALIPDLVSNEKSGKQ